MSFVNEWYKLLCKKVAQVVDNNFDEIKKIDCDGDDEGIDTMASGFGTSLVLMRRELISLKLSVGEDSW